MTDIAELIAAKRAEIAAAVPGVGDWSAYSGPTDGEPVEDCPYFAAQHELPGSDPKGTCSHGCWEEPRCMTDGIVEDPQRLRDEAVAWHQRVAELSVEIRRWYGGDR